MEINATNIMRAIERVIASKEAATKVFRADNKLRAARYAEADAQVLRDLRDGAPSLVSAIAAELDKIINDDTETVTPSTFTRAQHAELKQIIPYIIAEHKRNHA